jgi:type II secretory pathway pseudopilin PulG
MVELGVVMALMTVLAVLAVPNLLAGDALGQDQQAKTTAAAASEAVTRGYVTSVASRHYDAEMVSTLRNAKIAELGRPLTPAEISALPRPPRRPDVSPATLRAANPDVKFVAGAVASRGPGTASVWSRYVGTPTDEANSHWVVGIAVNLPPEADGGTGVCWMSQTALGAPVGARPDTFMLFKYKNQNSNITTASSPDADQCSGYTAARLTPSQLIGDPGNTSNGSTRIRGTAWNAPLIVSAARVTAANS